MICLIPNTSSRLRRKFPPFSYLFLREGHSPPKGNRKTSPDPKDDPSTALADEIVCRQCLHGITSFAQRIDVNGAHRHTFANPEGIVFDISCFNSAWGCGPIGAPSMEFTWFAGYSWRIAICANCHIHLGWLFSGRGGHRFYGLISDRLSTS